MTTPPIPTPRALRHMAARLTDQRQAALDAGTLHPESLRAARLLSEADVLRGLADALEGVTVEGLAAIGEALHDAQSGSRYLDTDEERQEYNRTTIRMAEATLAHIRALTTAPDPDGAGRVVGAIERALGATEGE